jgi:hypothetical protein
MPVNFNELLQKPTADVKKPPVLNDGLYYGVLGQFSLQESRQKKTPFASYPVTLTGAVDGVDLVDDEGNPIDVNGVKKQVDMYLSENAQFRIVELAKNLGLDTEGLTLGQVLPMLVGQTVLLEINKVPAADGTRMVNRVGDAKAPNEA